LHGLSKEAENSKERVDHEEEENPERIKHKIAEALILMLYQ